MSRRGDQETHGTDDLVNPFNIGSTPGEEGHQTFKNDHLRTYTAGLPIFKTKDKNLTWMFLKFLTMEVPKNKIDIQGFHVYGGPSCGKCVKKDTIITVNNTLMEFEEYEKIHNKEDLVLSDYKNHQTGIFFTEETDHTIEIKLKGGTILEGTPEHKIKVLAKEGIVWKRLDEIEQNETVLVAHNQNIFNEDKVEVTFEYKKRDGDYNSKKLNKRKYIINEDIGYLMGQIIGDGSISRKEVTITVPIEEIKNKILKIFKKEFAVSPTVTDIEGVNIDYWSIRLSSVRFSALMKECGMKQVHAEEKIVPMSIRRSPRSVQIQFLRGLFESDGWMGVQRFEYYTASKKLASMVRAMLMNLGIYCMLRNRKVKGYDNTYWTVAVPIDDTVKLLELLDNTFRFQNVKIKKEEKNRSNIARIPKQSSMKHFIRNILDNNYARVCSGFYKWGNKNKRTEEKYRRLSKMSSGMTNKFFTKIAELDGSIPEIEEVLDYIIENDVYLVNVVEIKHYRDKKKVYDFHIPNNHTFIGNNIINHNSTLTRAIGHHMKEHYGDRIQCIETSFFPNALDEIDPGCDVIYISVDDPMGGGEEGGSQHARQGMSEAMQHAIEKYNAVRHIYRKKVLEHRAKKVYGDPLPTQIQGWIDNYYKNPDKLLEYFPKKIAEVSAILYIGWGPQLPTIDQTFHQNKKFEIYKGLSAMDQKRESEISSRIGRDWLAKLGRKEEQWSVFNKMEAKSWSVIRSIYRKEIGWLYMEPAPENVMQDVRTGAKGVQKKIKTDTDSMDSWARYIYEERNDLMPPYDPFDKKENRVRALKNFITDILRSNKDPRNNFDQLIPNNQLFLQTILKSGIQRLDDRIIKHHYGSQDERKQIEDVARQLTRILEEEGLSPTMKSGRNIAKDIARQKITKHRELLDKTSMFMKIFDHVLYIWYQIHPEEFTKKQKEGMTSAGERMKSKGDDEKLLKEATVEDENEIRFKIDEMSIINSILEESDEWNDRAYIYIHSEGLGEHGILSQNEILKISQSERASEFGFDQPFKSIEAIKYRKKQFRGIMSYKLGKLFEDWLDEIIGEGYELPGMIEDVVDFQHPEYEETHGQPDFVLNHKGESHTIVSAKCFASTRSETISKSELGPEIRYHNTLVQEGKKSRIVVVYQNIKIDNCLIAYEFDKVSDIPENLTFPPSMAGRYVFKKQKK